ncbi:DNA gyrase subunit A [Acetobacter malorum DSM 14337]|uniref:DNA topoisomerase (ATP-hydrolyzing) n=1 Tax=Acetobacter malorum DSM 14337 TaxID=1307910 RepID=A0ABQ0PYY8_9PROT|nr:DNA gyrase subunit A [Acetobacter malorum]GBQ85072.1 DNA gyrase subunit A [Acetobacter malorum DSM 14337]
MSNSDNMIEDQNDIDETLADEVEGKDIGAVNIVPMEDSMSTSYLNYAMSVIASRALPDVRDGLKPVHRRVVYGAAPFISKGVVKSARIVGDVMGKYHPHGDASIYDSLVRMAQDWTMRLPIILGQGNFGSIDGDSPAAMRYTEAQLQPQAHIALMKDIDLDTVDFVPNYDESEQEPSVLPARIPLLLINGVEGIAVGFASSIPPHNPEEVIQATIAVIRDPSISDEALRQIMPGPDFPTGAVCVDNGGYAKAFATGNGSVRLVGTHELKTFESGKKAGRQQIILTSIPYMVNKSGLVAKINEMKNTKGEKSFGFGDIQEIRDESSQKGIRIVLDLKKDANADLILKNLESRTLFSRSVNYNLTVRGPGGKPLLLGVRQVMDEFIDFRREVLWRRTNFLLEKERKRLRTLTGLFAARTQIRDVVKIIQDSEDGPSAKLALLEMKFPVEADLAKYLQAVEPDDDLPEVFRLTEDQAKSILEMRLINLTKLQLNDIADEAVKLKASMEGNLHLLATPAALDEVMISEMEEFLQGYGSCPRLTELQRGVDEVEDFQLYPNVPVVLSVTHRSYVRITEQDSFREQNRGGKGRKAGAVPRDEDFVTHTVPCMTHDMLTFFTSYGKAYAVRAGSFPMTASSSAGRPIVNYGIELEDGEQIAAVIKMPATTAEAEDKYLMFVTSAGSVRRNKMSDFMNIRSNGKKAMKSQDGGDINLLAVLPCHEDVEDLILASSSGRAVRFQINAKNIRVFASRDSAGTRGITLGPAERCVSACIVHHSDATPNERQAYLAGGEKVIKEGDSEFTVKLTQEQMESMAATDVTLITVSERAIGKRFSSHEVRVSSRGTKGVSIGTFTPATGGLVGLLPSGDTDGLLIVTSGGQAIRTGCKGIRRIARSGRGVILFQVPPGDKIASLCILEASTAGEFEDEDDLEATEAEGEEASETDDEGTVENASAESDEE